MAAFITPSDPGSLRGGEVGLIDYDETSGEGIPHYAPPVNLTMPLRTTPSSNPWNTREIHPLGEAPARPRSCVQAVGPNGSDARLALDKVAPDSILSRIFLQRVVWTQPAGCARRRTRV